VYWPAPLAITGALVQVAPAIVTVAPGVAVPVIVVSNEDIGLIVGAVVVAVAVVASATFVVAG
jgi:hypothetical protein